MVTKRSNTKNYYEGIGRRKTAVARVRIIPSDELNVIVNDKNFADYFQTEELRNIVLDAHKASGLKQLFNISIHLSGSGIHAQSEAARHGLGRAILNYDANLRPQLKASDVLKRDSRAVERKKPGLKKARKSPTWSKR